MGYTTFSDTPILELFSSKKRAPVSSKSHSAFLDGNPLWRNRPPRKISSNQPCVVPLLMNIINGFFASKIIKNHDEIKNIMMKPWWNIMMKRIMMKPWWNESCGFLKIKCQVSTSEIQKIQSRWASRSWRRVLTILTSESRKKSGNSQSFSVAQMGVSENVG